MLPLDTPADPGWVISGCAYLHVQHRLPCLLGCTCFFAESLLGGWPCQSRTSRQRGDCLPVASRRAEDSVSSSPLCRAGKWGVFHPRAGAHSGRVRFRAPFSYIMRPTGRYSAIFAAKFFLCLGGIMRQLMENVLSANSNCCKFPPMHFESGFSHFFGFFRVRPGDFPDPPGGCHKK